MSHVVQTQVRDAAAVRAGCKINHCIVVVLAPVVQLPVELEKLFVVVQYQRPNRDQLTEIARGVATEENELPDGTH